MNPPGPLKGTIPGSWETLTWSVWNMIFKVLNSFAFDFSQEIEGGPLARQTELHKYFYVIQNLNIFFVTEVLTFILKKCRFESKC